MCSEVLLLRHNEKRVRFVSAICTSSNLHGPTKGCFLKVLVFSYHHCPPKRHPVGPPGKESILPFAQWLWVKTVFR